MRVGVLAGRRYVNYEFLDSARIHFAGRRRRRPGRRVRQEVHRQQRGVADPQRAVERRVPVGLVGHDLVGAPVRVQPERRQRRLRTPRRPTVVIATATAKAAAAAAASSYRHARAV